ETHDHFYAMRTNRSLHPRVAPVDSGGSASCVVGDDREIVPVLVRRRNARATLAPRSQTEPSLERSLRRYRLFHLPLLWHREPTATGLGMFLQLACAPSHRG